MYKVYGVVEDGGGSSSKIMKGRLLSKIRDRAGIKIVPGTLNIELEGDYNKVSLKSFSCNGERYFISKSPIKLNDVDVYSFRAPRGSRKKNKIEIISDKRLRDFLNIKTGDRVCVIL